MIAPPLYAIFTTDPYELYETTDNWGHAKQTADKVDGLVVNLAVVYHSAMTESRRNSQ